MNSAGAIIGRGYHGTTQDGYPRCGAANGGVQGLTPQTIYLVSEVKLAPVNPLDMLESRISYPRVVVDTAVFPYASLSMEASSPVTTDADGVLVRGPTSYATSGHAPDEVTVIASNDGSAINKPVYTITAGRLTKAVQNGRLSFQLGATCLPR